MGSPRTPVRRLATARLISSVGNAAAIVAIAYDIYRRTGSAFWLTLVYLLTFGITGFLSPLAGSLADRYNRRTIMVASDLVSAVFFALLIWASTPIVIVALAFLATVAATPFRSASGAAIPNLAPKDQLSWANSLVSTTGWTGRLVGFAIGGGIVAAWGAGAVYLIDAVSFVLSALLVSSIHVPFGVPRTEGEVSPRWTEGFAIIWRSSLLRSLVVAWALMYFAIDMVSVAEVPLAKVFRAGAVGVGLLEAAFAGGAVLGAFAGRWIRQEWERKALIVDTLATTVDALIVSVTPWFGTALVADFAGSAMDSFASVAGYSLIQRRTDDAVRGRVLGAMESTFLLANVVSFVVAGSVIGWIGARGVYALSGAISFCAFVVLALEFGRRRGGARVGVRGPGEDEPDRSD